MRRSQPSRFGFLCLRLAAVAVLAVSCVVEGEGPAALGITGTHPGPGATIPADEAIRVRFDRYLDPTIDPAPGVRLTSGDEDLPARVAYDPADPALVVVPVGGLRAGLGYTLTVAPEAARGLDDTRLPQPFELSFLAGVAREPPGAIRRVDYARDVAPLFARFCGCHGPEPLVYPPLEPAALLGAPSRRQPGAVLVDPGRPLRSHLVLKILPEHPGVLGESMPPGAPLGVAQRRLIVAWVAQLRP